MKEFVEYVAKQLVDQPDEVAVEETAVGENVLLKLRVAQTDVGKIIGKKGRTAFALRTLFAAVGKKAGKKVSLEVLD
jgi:predicted RNA-binding protein YlqC (UPF0109 family)